MMMFSSKDNMIMLDKIPRNGSLMIKWDTINCRDDLVILVKNLDSGFMVIKRIIVRSKSYNVHPRYSPGQYRYICEIYDPSSS